MSLLGARGRMLWFGSEMFSRTIMYSETRLLEVDWITEALHSSMDSFIGKIGVECAVWALLEEAGHWGCDLEGCIALSDFFSSLLPGCHDASLGFLSLGPSIIPFLLWL